MTLSITGDGHRSQTIYKSIGSRFRVQACPGATGCECEIEFTSYVLDWLSAYLDRPGLGAGVQRL